MTVPTPYHSRTAPLCEALQFKDWAGYHAVTSYDTCHEREYHAFRTAAGLIDVSPLYKYRVTGPDAVSFLDRLITRRIKSVKVGTVVYTCWCNEHGKVLDDGTVTRIGKEEFRITSADPNLHWFLDVADGMNVSVEDVSEELCALSLQGPRARDILDAATGGAVKTLGFFKYTQATLGEVPVEVTRTGYTGDLGYEVWAAPEHAGQVWDALMAAGASYCLQPAGLDAMDMTRIEAGFVLLGVDYVSARKARIPMQLSSPFEIGLGWTVHFKKKGEFIGRAALEREKAAGSEWALVGLVCDWEEIEALHAKFGLPPSIPSTPWRDGRPVYGSRNGRQVGRATCGTWSPILKKNIALASVISELSDPGQKLYLEMTVEYERHQVQARVAQPRNRS